MKTRKELERSNDLLSKVCFVLILISFVFVVWFVLTLPDFLSVDSLETQLSECQDKISDGREVNVTIEGFDRLKLQLWCWWKDYPNFDSNSSYIWEIVRKCEVLD